MNKLEKLLHKFDHLGICQVPNGSILVGRAPHIASEAWLNVIYAKLNSSDIDELENSLNDSIPLVYKHFLLEFSNGISILNGVFTLDGYRPDYDRSIEGSRLPFSLEIPNLHERPKNAKKNHFFIGGYNWDGSHLYIDKDTGIVHYCDRWDVTSLYQWKSFDNMLISEIERIYSLHDSNGIIINEDICTTPIDR